MREVGATFLASLPISLRRRAAQGLRKTYGRGYCRGGLAFGHLDAGRDSPKQAPRLGGFGYAFSGSDIQRTREVGAWNMGELAVRDTCLPEGAQGLTGPPCRGLAAKQVSD